MKKNVTKSKEKKLTDPIKLDLSSCPLSPLIFIKGCTRSIIFVTFCHTWSKSSIYLWTNFLEVHWRCPQNIALQNPKKKSQFLYTYISIKRYTWFINFETIHWNLSIYWTYSESNLASSHNPKKNTSKALQNSLQFFFLMQKKKFLQNCLFMYALYYEVRIH